MFGVTESKYLAGLLDADGCLHYSNNNGYLSLNLSCSLSESIDHKGKFAKYLESKVGSLYTRKREENWAIQNEWVVRRRTDLNLVLPHIIKHMVVKGAKWSIMFKRFQEYQGIHITDEDIKSLRKEVDNVNGPEKPKKHPTWAWVAGYIDGDGWYIRREREGKKNIEMHVGLVSHPSSDQGIQLVYKAFGGVVKIDSKGYTRWVKNLGIRDKEFAIYFLRKMVNHSKLKKHKIEQLLSTYPQRLSVDKS